MVYNWINLIIGIVTIICPIAAGVKGASLWLHICLLYTSGNAAVAYAMKQINPDVVAAYPITPQTDCVERFAEYVSEGLVDSEFITVESEHSAMSACIGAAAAGGRVMTATAANGLALMLSLIHI